MQSVGKIVACHLDESTTHPNEKRKVIASPDDLCRDEAI